jgi:hypothetical protein
VWKYAGLYALLDGSFQIGAEHLELGLVVVRYLKETVLVAVGDFGMTDRVRARNVVEGVIEKAGVAGIADNKMNTSRITASQRTLVKEYGLDRLVRQLVDDGDVEMVENGDGTFYVHRNHRP